MAEARLERPDELLARRILEYELDVSLEQYDTGQCRGDIPANGQFDYLALTDPPQPVEVVGDHEHGRPKQLAELARKGATVEIAELQHGWMLWLSAAANIAKLHARLPEAFAELGDIDAAYEAARRFSWEATPPPLRALGVQTMTPLDAHEPHVRLVPGMVSHSSADADVGALVDAVLHRQPDAAAKVLRFSADRRHVVIVSMFGAAHNEWSAIRHGVRSALTDPHPPAGVTDLWLIFAVQPSQGAHWNSGGWRLFDPLAGLPDDML